MCEAGPSIHNRVARRTSLLNAMKCRGRWKRWGQIVSFLAGLLVVAGEFVCASEPDFTQRLTARRPSVSENLPETHRPKLRRKRTTAVLAGTNNVPDVWTWQCAQATNSAGSFLVGIGDVNADGFGDLAIGAPWFSRSGVEHVGAVLLFLGSASGPRATPDAELWGSNPGGGFGFQVVRAGDIDGDGFDDVAIAVEQGAATARVVVHFGSPSGLCPEPGWRFTPPEDCPSCYVTTSAVGDVNGDGHADLGIGLFCDHHGSKEETRLLVFHGSATGLSSKPDWVASGLRSFGEIGSAGDVNGDGFDDVLAAFPEYRHRAVGDGKVFLFHGSPVGLSLEPNWEAVYEPADPARDQAADQHFGGAARTAGDVNGDGFDDVLVTAWFGDHGEVNEGLAFVYHGSAAGLSRQPDWRSEANQAHALFGCSAASLGDVNGDGFFDIIIGAMQASHGQLLEGACAVFLGSRSGLQLEPAWTAESDVNRQHFGSVVAAAGDVNGDGVADVAVSAPRRVLDSPQSGFVRLYFGTRHGLPNSSGWRLDSPDASLARWQQAVVALVALGVIAAIAAGLRRLRERSRLARLKTEIDRQARQAERASLAQDLHDQIGPEIARIARASGPAAAREIVSVIESFDETVWMANPRHDTLESLATFLGQQGDRMFADASMKLTYRHPLNLPELPILPGMRKAVYLTVKEALHNALKHSGAREVRLELEWLDGVLQVRVSDNGRGFPGETRRFGNGLSNMRSRVESIEGHLLIESDATTGAKITFSVPLQGSE